VGRVYRLIDQAPGDVGGVLGPEHKSRGPEVVLGMKRVKPVWHKYFYKCGNLFVFGPAPEGPVASCRELPFEPV